MLAICFPGLFGFEKWVPNVSLIWGREDSDIEFNRVGMWLAGVSLFRKF